MTLIKGKISACIYDSIECHLDKEILREYTFHSFLDICNDFYARGNIVGDYGNLIRRKFSGK